MHVKHLVLLISVLTLTFFNVNAEEPEVIEEVVEVPVAIEKNVVILESDNFHKFVQSKDVLLVEFYAPWCGHCKSLEPEYAKAAEELKPENIRIAKVDATKEPELAKEFSVTGYPTIKLFKKGEFVEDFEGSRTAKGIVDYMRRHADPNYVPPPTAVITLTEENFTSIVHSQPLSLVEFYAPWCGHCKAFAPEYESAAVDLKSEGIPLYAVDAQENGKLASTYGVQGFPTIKVFRYERAYEYKGGRDASGVVSYMKDQMRLPSQEVRTAVNLKNAVLRTQNTVFGYFTSDKEPLYAEFIAAANDMRGEMAFVHTFDSSIAATYKLKTANNIAFLMPEVYYSKYEKAVQVMEQDAANVPTSNEIVQWVKKSSIPLLGERTPENQGTTYTQRPLLVVYATVDWSHQHVKATQHLRSKLLPLFVKYRDVLTFALSDEEKFDKEMESVGLGDSGESVNAAIFTDKKKYPMDPEDDYIEELEEFIEKFKKGKLKPYIKSAPVPSKQSVVKVLVAKNFEKEVKHGDKDYLIEFYAPWCGHCKKLEPVYKQLAKKLEKEKSKVVVAKFDATSNDLPDHYEVEGFPTIYYVKGSDIEKPVKYSGDRSLKHLLEFVEEQQNPDSSREEEEVSAKDEL